MSVFWYLLIPLITSGMIAVAAAVRLSSQAERRREWVRRCLLSAGVTVLTLTTLSLITHAAACTVILSPPIILAVSLGITALCLVAPRDPLAASNPSLCRFLRQAGVAVMAAVLIETVLCSMYAPQGDCVQVPLSLSSGTVSGRTETDNDRVVMSDGSLDLSFCAHGIHAVNVTFEERETPVQLAFYIKDNNFSERFIRVAERQYAGDSGVIAVPISAFGELYALRITAVNTYNEPLVLTQVSLSNGIVSDFSAWRFAVMAAVGVLIAAICCFRWYRIDYDRQKRSHKAAVVTVCMLCVGVNAALFVPYFLPDDNADAYQHGDTVRDVAYPLDYIGGQEAYIQQFDALYKGQLHLDVEPSKELTTLENPYDDSTRGGVSYLWDRALYDGKYYSYFGITPLLVFGVPYYLLTGSVPRTAVTGGFFAVAAMILLCVLLLKMIKLFVKRCNLLILLMGLVASAAASGVWWQHLLAGDYAVPKTSGLCFLFLTLWLGLAAYDSRRRLLQPLAFFLCGTAAVLTIGARPTLVFGLLLLSPACIHTLVRRDRSPRRKAACAAAFLVPLILGGAALMWFNAARFGSPFEFGATYQLTVSNIAASTLSLSFLPSAVFHYFLQPLSVDTMFPYWRPSYTADANLGRYLFSESTVGALSFPMVLTGFAALPSIAKRAASRQPVKCATYLLAPILATAAAFVTFCKGGVSLSYTADVFPICVIVALPIVAETYSRLQKRLDSRHFPVFAAVLSATVLVGACTTLFVAQNSVIVKEFYPHLLAKLAAICP